MALRRESVKYAVSRVSATSLTNVSAPGTASWSCAMSPPVRPS
jgi:hypothetical protein